MIEQKKADQNCFRAMIKQCMDELGWNQTEVSVATGVRSDQQLLNKFLNRRRDVGVQVAERWAKTLGIARDDMPSSLKWAIDPIEENRTLIAPYLVQLGRLEQLPYYAVLQHKLGKQGLTPPPLTKVYVRPEYRKEIDAPSIQGGTLPRLRQGLDEALETYRHVVLQGVPGSGKSSVAFKLALDLASSVQTGSAQRSWVPIPVIAREFVELRRSHSFVEALSAHIKRRFGVNLPPEVFETDPPYKRSKWLLIFDGIDEIVEQDARTELILEINAHAKQSLSPYKFLVISRPLSELLPLEGQEFARYVLLAFNEDQVQDFIERWFQALAGDQAEEMATNFDRWLKTGGLGDIATSPAMLTIAAIVYQHTQGALPNSRIDLYAAYVDIMLDQNLKGSWNVGRALRGVLNAEEEYGEAGRELANGLVSIQRPLFELCALRLQTVPELDFVKTAIEMIQKEPWFSNVPSDLKSEPHKLEKWIEELLRGSGVLQDNFASFSFVHNTMREFFAAARLESMWADEADMWTLVRRWGEARWREIILFFMALRSRKVDGRAGVSACLERICLSGPRGVHFAGTALAEGVLVEDTTADVIVDAVIERANSWNLCSEIFAEFKSPDVTEILRMFAQHPRIRAAVFGYVKRGGIDCPKSLRALFDVSEEIADSTELAMLADKARSLWVRAGAISGLLRSGNYDLGAPRLKQLIPRLGPQSGIDLVLALVSCGTQRDLMWVAYCEEVHQITRLTALLYLNDDMLAENARLADIDRLMDAIEDWKPLTGDILVKLAKDNLLSLLLPRPSLLRTQALEFCKALLDADQADDVKSYLEEALNTGDLHNRATAAKLLAQLIPASNLLPNVQRLCVTARDSHSVFLELAELCGSLGDDSFLKEAMKQRWVQVDERCRAAVAYARLQSGNRTEALTALREIAQEVKDDTNIELTYPVEAALDIDASDETITEVMSWIAGYTGNDPRGFPKLYYLAKSEALAQQVGNSNMTSGQKGYAIRALRALGEGEKLYELAKDPKIDIHQRAECLVELLRLGWVSEVKEYARALLSAAPAEQKLYVLKHHISLGLTDRAHSSLTWSSCNDEVAPEDRFLAAQLLSGYPWKESPSLDLVAQLLAEERAEDLRFRTVFWLEMYDFGPDSTLGVPLQTLVFDAIISLLRYATLEHFVRDRLVSFLENKFGHVKLPADML